VGGAMETEVCKAELLRLRGGVGDPGSGGASPLLAADGIAATAAMPSSGRMFTGIRERPTKSPSELLAAMAPSVQMQPRPVKFIYIVSDSTGFTASHALTSCMTQFEGLLVDYNRSENPRVAPC
jgi:hypothetical protein